MPLPLMPVISVSSVKYSDTSGAEQTISSANYNLRNDTGGAYVEFLSTYSFPALNVEGSAVRIEYIAGYTQSSNTSTIPDAIRTAILLLIGHWYANREAAVVSQSSSASAITLPFAVEALLAPFRRVRF
jgi:uncharacterized phiE125 gp8 family phage protein